MFYVRKKVIDILRLAFFMDVVRYESYNIQTNNLQEIPQNEIIIVLILIVVISDYFKSNDLFDQWKINAVKHSSYCDDSVFSNSFSCFYTITQFSHTDQFIAFCLTFFFFFSLLCILVHIFKYTIQDIVTIEYWIVTNEH